MKKILNLIASQKNVVKNRGFVVDVFIEGEKKFKKFVEEMTKLGFVKKRTGYVNKKHNLYCNYSWQDIGGINIYMFNVHYESARTEIYNALKYEVKYASSKYYFSDMMNQIYKQKI